MPAIHVLNSCPLRFDQIFSIDGNSESSIQADLVSHIRSLSPLNAQTSLKDAFLWLVDPRNTQWLLFIDNVDDIEMNLAAFLPDCNHGSILVTTRNRHLGRLASKKECHIELDVMSEDEALDMLQRTVSSDQFLWKEKSLSDVTKALGYLPVALAQAGAYMCENMCSAEDYLRLYKQSQDQLLMYEAQSRHKANAYAAFDVSFRRLPIEIQDFLYIASHYHFSGFPMAAFNHAGASEFRRDPFEYLPREPTFEESISILKKIFFKDGKWAEESMHRVIRLLQSYSMASFSSNFKTKLLTVHPLFHDWLFNRIPSERRPFFLSAATRILTCGQGEKWMGPQLFPHILYIISSNEKRLIHINDRASLSFTMGYYGDNESAKRSWLDIYTTLDQQKGEQGLAFASASAELGGLYDDDLSKMAELEQQALKIYESILGSDHEKSHFMFLELASTYERQGNYEEAGGMYKRVMECRKEKYGEDDLVHLEAMKRLACCNQSQKSDVAIEKLLSTVLHRRRKILGNDHDETLSAMHQLSMSYLSLGRHSEAVELKVEYVNTLTEKLGEYHIKTIWALRDLSVTYRSLGQYSKADQLDKEWIKRHKAKPAENELSAVWVMHELALSCYNQSRYSEAEDLETEVVRRMGERYGESHADMLSSKHLLAMIYDGQGRYSDAEKLYTELIKRRKETQGDDHRSFISSMYSLARNYSFQKRHCDAEKLYKEVLKQLRDKHSDDHARILDVLRTLARFYELRGRHSEATEMKAEQAIQWKNMSRANQLDVLRYMYNLTMIYFNAGRYSEAEVSSNEAICRQTDILGESHFDTLQSTHLLGKIYQAQGRYTESESLYMKTLTSWKASFGEYHIDTLYSMHGLAVIYHNKGWGLEAERLESKVMKGRREKLGDDHPETMSSMYLLAKIYQDQGRYPEAEVLQLDLVEQQKKHLGEEHTDTLQSLYDLSWNYLHQNKYSEAESLSSRLLEKRKQILGEDHSDTLKAKCLLDEINLSRGRSPEVTSTT
jgi:tetratricopeptide (TPR) repeat protein